MDIFGWGGGQSRSLTSETSFLRSSYAGSTRESKSCQRFIADSSPPNTLEPEQLIVPWQVIRMAEERARGWILSVGEWRQTFEEALRDGLSEFLLSSHSDEHPLAVRRHHIFPVG